MIKQVLSLAVLLSLSVTTPNAHASIFSAVSMDSTDVQDAQKKKGGFMVFKKELSDLKIDGKEKSLRGKTKIAVPFFRVNFVTGDKYRNAVKTGMGANATSKVKSSLSGVETETFQAVTDEMHADFIRQLQQAGYDVIPTDDIQKTEKFAKLESDYPNVKRSVTKVTASSLPFPGKFKNPAPGISKELDAVVLKVDLNIDYLIINKNEKRFNITKDVSHVDVTQGINVTGTITAFTKNNMVLITLQQPVTSQRPFGMVEDQTSTLSKVNDTLVLASGWLSPSGLGSKRQTSRNFDVAANSEQYRLAVGDALVQINRKIAETLKSFREKE